MTWLCAMYTHSYKIYARKRDNFEVQRALPRIKNVGEMSNFILPSWIDKNIFDDN